MAEWTGQVRREKALLQAQVAAAEERLVGRDADRLVEVVMSPKAEVIAVRLSPRWRQSVPPAR